MEVIGHNDIPNDIGVVFFFQQAKPVIYQIVTVGYFKEWQPFRAGECDKISGESIAVLQLYCHCIKLLNAECGCIWWLALLYVGVSPKEIF